MPSTEVGLAAGLALLVAGCATTTPEAGLAAYADALERADGVAVHANSDATTRAAHDPEAVQARLREDPEAARALGAALRAPLEIEQLAYARLEDGRRVRLVWESGAWRVAAGGLELARYDTPEAALRTLLAAARAGRLDEVRGAIPDAFAARYASDDALRAHLEVVWPRLEAAWAAIRPLEPGRAQVEGDRARLTYGPSRAVRFVREAGAWRVLDAE